MYGLHIIRDIGYWRLNVHFKILLLDLGTSLTEYQKKISTTAETFLNKIILHSGGNIMTEKGQLGNKTVEILEVLPPTQERHWETSVWSWINLCGVLGTYLSLKSWFLRTKFQRFKPRAVLRCIRLDLMLLTGNPSAWDQVWWLFFMHTKCSKTKKNTESTKQSRTGLELILRLALS